MTIDDIRKLVPTEAHVIQRSPKLFQVALPYEIFGNQLCVVIKKVKEWQYSDDFQIYPLIDKGLFLRNWNRFKSPLTFEQDEFFMPLDGAQNSRKFEIFVSTLMGILGDYHREKIDAKDVA